MKLEIAQKGGTTHEVELQGSVVVIGRDPGCDVVLSDPKCSRRHAVLEEGPEGILVRDPGSANGISVNGRRVERARLQPGDALRVGDTVLTLLAEIGETVVMAPDDLELRTVVGAPRPPAPAPALALRPPVEPPPRDTAPRGAVPPVLPRRSAPAPAVRPARPATVGVLAGLWALFVPASVAASLYAAQVLGGGALAWGLAAIASLLLAGLGTAMALGLRTLAPWARHLQIVTAAVGLVVCPFTLASATVLLYMVRPEVKAAFEGRARPEDRPANGTADATFALSLVGMLALGAALTAITALLL
jgi:predicted component of type VI protein secretion system